MFTKIRNMNIVKQFVQLITDFIEQLQSLKGFKLYMLIKRFENLVQVAPKIRLAPAQLRIW